MRGVVGYVTNTPVLRFHPIERFKRGVLYPTNKGRLLFSLRRLRASRRVKSCQFGAYLFFLGVFVAERLEKKIFSATITPVVRSPFKGLATRIQRWLSFYTQREEGYFYVLVRADRSTPIQAPQPGSDSPALLRRFALAPRHENLYDRREENTRYAHK